MELSGRKRNGKERIWKRKIGRQQQVFKKREGEGERGRREGDREEGRHVEFCFCCEASLAHSEGQSSHEQINNRLQVAHGCMLYPLISDNLPQFSGHLSLMAWVFFGTGREEDSVLNIPYGNFYQWPRNDKAFLRSHLPWWGRSRKCNPDKMQSYRQDWDTGYGVIGTRV